MAWEDFEFTPENGLENTTTFPSKPTSGAAARTQFMTILNQIKAFFNGTVKDTIDEHKADLTPHLVPACFVYKSTAQSVANGSYALLGFDVEKFDTHEMHDNSIDNSRITIPVDGKYLVIGSCSYASNATGYREAQLTVNGVAIRTTRQNAVSGVETEFTVEIVRDFTAGQYIQLLVRQNSGGALNLLNGLAFTTLSVIKIG